MGVRLFLVGSLYPCSHTVAAERHGGWERTQLWGLLALTSWISKFWKPGASGNGQQVFFGLKSTHGRLCLAVLTLLESPASFSVMSRGQRVCVCEYKIEKWCLLWREFCLQHTLT